MMGDVMDQQKQLAAETEAYLAKIRETVRASKELVESTKLRLAETDRLLARQGLTREDVEKMPITEEQQRLVDEELKRRGFEPIATLDGDAAAWGGNVSVATEEASRPAASVASANLTAGDGDGSVENRKRRFNVMMQQFRM